MTNLQKWFTTFFEEKDLPNAQWEIEHEGQVHLVDSEFIQEVIIKSTPTHEQKGIQNVLVKIDFKDGDVNHFLRHLAEGYVINNY